MDQSIETVADGGDSPVRAILREFLERRFLFEFDGEVTDTTDLFKAGIVDSFGYLQMIQFLRERFGVEFTREEVLASIVTSLASIAKTVESRMGQRA